MNFWALATGVSFLLGMFFSGSAAYYVDSLFNDSSSYEEQIKNNKVVEAFTNTMYYDNDIFDLVTRERVRDDNKGPIIYIVKDKGTSKEYIIFINYDGNSMKVLPR